jgi:hypothetical protein
MISSLQETSKCSREPALRTWPIFSQKLTPFITINLHADLMYMTGMRKPKDQPMMPYFPRNPKPLEAFRENLLYEFTKTGQPKQK